MTIETRESAFLAHMREYAGRPVYFERLGGNRGDMLIRLGGEHVLQKAGCHLVESPGKADCILMNGGDSISDIWYRGIDMLTGFRRDFPEIPVVVAPSTFRFPQDALDRICAPSKTPLHMFAREERSFDLLNGLDHPPFLHHHRSQDLAFELIDSPFLQEWRTRCHDNYILIAMRMDEESHSSLLRKIAALRSRVGAMPHMVQRIAYHTHKRLVDMHWRSRCARILKNNPQPRSCPIRRLDASIAESFEAFCQLVADARYIISDRMHVGILAYLLNKPATLIGNSYYKTQAVYEFSMNHEGSPVKFISGVDA